MKRFALSLLLSLQALAVTPAQQTDINEFVENMKPVQNLFELNKYNIRSVTLPADKAPWSGSFWPDRAGSIAVSYTDSKFIEQMKIIFGSRLAESSFNSQQEDIEKELFMMSEKDLNKLSPAEKYDLLMGDTTFSLSKQIWKRINKVNDYADGLAFWSGICHGWAPAAISMPRPKHAVTLPILGGRRMITFYPEDLKALGSYLWASMANNDDKMKFAGNRCNISSPKKNKRTDLVEPLTNPTRDAGECGDTDPVTFHLVTLNRLGLQKKSFIADIDYNSKVNNHPVVGYKMYYFNPISGKYGPLAKSLAKISTLAYDPLKELRNPNAKYVVGIHMSMKFADWKIPGKDQTDSFDKDGHIARNYLYQLEIDTKGNILGGHWRTRKLNAFPRNSRSKPAVAGMKAAKPNYPDFIWAYSDNFVPREYFTYVSEGLDLTLDRGLSVDWTEASIKNATNSMLLLNSTRIRHSKARDKKLDQKARELAKRSGITEEAAADKYSAIMDKLGIPKEKENPQVLSKVIYKLFDLAK